MIYTSFQALYCVLLQGKPSSTRAPKIICTVLPALITAIYLAYPNPIFHQVSYGILQLYITYHLEIMRAKLPAGSKLKKDCTHLLTTGTILSVVAFAIWNMDNILCDNITAWRAQAGTIGVISQGHAWWHILVACGSNRMVTAIIGNLFFYSFRLEC
jgi:dihydroceramidase